MTTHLGGPESPARLAERQVRYEQPGSRQYSVHVDDVAAGYMGYWEREWRAEEVWETGWAVAPELQGRGVASVAMRLLLDMIAAEPVSRAVHAFPSVDNGPSNALCRKLGFELLGAFDFEYPAGHPLRCNDWVMDLRERCSPAPPGVESAGQRDGRTVACPAGETRNSTRGKSELRDAG